MANTEMMDWQMRYLRFGQNLKIQVCKYNYAQFNILTCARAVVKIFCPQTHG